MSPTPLTIQPDTFGGDSIVEMERQIFRMKAIYKKHGGYPQPTNQSAKNVSPNRCKRKRKKK